MKIVVLAGGLSTERDVSFVSGMQVYKALKRKGHQAILMDVFLGYDGDVTEDIFEKDYDWAADIGAISESDPDIAKVKALRKDQSENFFGPNVIDLCQKADIVFLALHGANGEDGKIQAAFDLLGIKYTGTGYKSSALAIDKEITKQLFVRNNIPTPKDLLEGTNGDASALEYPCVVKVCCGGSSVGVYIVKNEAEYKEAVKQAGKYEGRILVERYIKGREFSVGVVDGKALPVIEIAPIKGFYDYKNKYQAGSAIETCPADIDATIAKVMGGVAERVVAALGIETYARMDFMMDEQNQFYCLEANTLPGMTPTSLLPQEAAAVGVSFDELCEWIVRISLNKYQN
ncbi:MAG: D-alanine--D-alanine ligase [bacterium]|nr:D-alanine--D-alanine ligase [bacterium]